MISNASKTALQRGRTARILAIALLIASVIGGAEASNTDPTRVRLELAAIDQIVDDLAFDVYHLVAVDPAEGVNTIEIAIQNASLIEAIGADGSFTRPTADLDSFRGSLIPYSFIVGGDSTAALEPVRTASRFSGVFTELGAELYEPGDPGFDGGTVIAVLTTPAREPRPELSETLGAAFTPIYGSPPGGQLPADLNGSGEVNFVDYGIFGAEYPGSPLLDLNRDGVTDARDVSVFMASFGRNATTSVIAGIDATSSDLVYTPGYFPPGTFDLSDLGTLGANFGSVAATIEQRDLNADRRVNLVDLAILGRGFVRPGQRLASIPEPTSVWLLAVAGVLVRQPR